MNLSKQRLMILGGATAVILTFVLMVLGILPGLKVNPNANRTTAKLVVWGVQDTKSELLPFFQAFTATRPGVEVSYQQFTDPDTYHRTLLESLASGSGPDVFAIRNTEVMRHVNKIVPLPQGTLSPAAARTAFVDTVLRDFSIGGTMVALPLSIDTLGLIYNRDLLNEAGVVSPPATWDELVALTPRLTKLDGSRRVSQAAVALGGSGSTIPRALDILSALMLQGGVTMINPNWSGASFATREGDAVVNFYLQFSNTGSSLYTWNEGMPNALDAFAQGKVAMILDYAAALPLIRERNPLMNVGTAPLPQRAGAEPPRTFASYWGYAVSRQSKQVGLAAPFVASLATEDAALTAYLAVSKRTPANPRFIESYSGNPDLAPFARQTLTAAAWPMPNEDATRGIVSTMLTAVIENRASVETAVAQAQSDVSRLVSERPR